MFESMGWHGGQSAPDVVVDVCESDEPSAPHTPAGAAGGSGASTVAEVLGWIDALSGVDHSVDDAGRVDLLGALERVKSGAAAAQAVVTCDLVASQRAVQVAAGVRTARVGAGIAAQVGLARRESPRRGSQHVGLAQALLSELPCTFAALRCGKVSEWRATIVARETACLDPADRRAADAELGPRLGRLGDRQVEAEARKVAYRLDPAAFTAR